MEFSQFGQFLSKGSGIVQLMDDLGSAAASGGEVFMLGGGNPGAIPAMQDYFRRAMADLLADSTRFDAVIGSYDSPDGDLRFRRSLATLLNDSYGWEIDERNIVVTNGSQSSFFVLFNLFSGRFVDQADAKRILLPLTPEYIGYADTGMGASIFTSNRPSIELLDGNLFKYHVDLDALHIDDDIGALCVSRPTNPTGNVLTDDEVDALRNLCRRHEIPLILDCAYGTPFPNIIFRDVKPVFDDNIVLCMSLSKLGLPGVRTGIVIANPQVIRAIGAANAILSLAPGSFGPALVLDAIENGDIIRLSNTAVRPFYQEKAEHTVTLMRRALDGLPYRIHQPEGAIFLWLWFEGMPIPSAELYRRLKARGVYVIAGEHFFPGLAGEWRHCQECIRVSYAMDSTMVQRGVDIIADEVRRAYAA
jgi:valine--pyruvate aminotransferase